VNEVDHPRINKCPKKRKERRHMLHMPLESERGGRGEGKGKEYQNQRKLYSSEKDAHCVQVYVV
jgi:hypothetical protein